MRNHYRNVAGPAVGVIVFVVFAFFGASIAPAQDTYWQHDPAAAGDWFDPVNWTSGKPTGSTDAYINNGGTARIDSWGATADYLYLGYDSGDSGTIELVSGGGLNLCCAYVVVGRKGTGTIIQTGGSMASRVYLGYSSGSHGTYQLSGATSTLSRDLTVGNAGTGLFQQFDGTVTMTNRLDIGFSGGSGTYELSGGQLKPKAGITVGFLGSGTFIQTGGTASIADEDDPARNSLAALVLSLYSSSSGEYQLIDGDLSAPNEYIGLEGTGLFTQTGGSNTPENLEITSQGRYEFFGGILNLQSGWKVAGEFDFDDRTVIWSPNSILVDLSGGQIQNAGNVSLSLGGDSLLIVDSGSDPGTMFGSFSNAGITHMAGTTLVVATGTSFTGWGKIDDLVDCAGTITAAAGGFLELTAGLIVSNNGMVDLGYGDLIVNTNGCGMNSGQILAHNESIGIRGTGDFTQISGNNNVTDYFQVGYRGSSSDPSANGTYVLEGGQLSANYASIGSGSYATGEFVQSGGDFSSSNVLSIGSNGGTGTFRTSGGVLNVLSLYIGYSGDGMFSIEDPAAQIRLSNKLVIGTDCDLTAMPGTQIKMGSSDLENKSTDPGKLTGLENLKLVFDGGSGNTASLEVASEDRGSGGFMHNFTLGTLTLGEGDVGQVQLVDLSDNQPDSENPEALYVINLVVGNGSQLDLNGLRLYYLQATIDPGATIRASAHSWAIYTR